MSNPSLKTDPSYADDVHVILPAEISGTSIERRVNFHDVDPYGRNELPSAGDIPAPSRNSLPVERDDRSQLMSHGLIPHFSYLQRVVAGSGHILNDLCASLWFTYFILYMEKVAGFSKRSAAALMFTGQIVDGLSTPLIGFEADRANHCWLCKRGYGRCKTWHLTGVFLVILSFPFVFSPCIGCETADEWARALYYAPFIAIFQIGWASSQISHLALIPKMSSDILIRTELFSIRYGFTVCANITVFILVWVTLGFEKCDRSGISGDDSGAFQIIAVVAVCIGGIFSVLFHVFVVEKSDEELRKVALLIKVEEMNAPHQTSTSGHHHHHNDFVESLSTVTNVRSVASSMAISKVQAQARRRSRSSSGQSAKSFADKEAGQRLLADQDDMMDRDVSVSLTTGTAQNPSVINCNPPDSSSGVRVHRGYSTKSLNLGKETVTICEWLSMPQFYIVAGMYMATRLSINITQTYMPMYLQENLKLPCASVATVPLTMFCSGFVISIFSKLINKYLGRQFAYALGASLCVTGGILILTLDWTPGSVVATKGIYGVAVLLGGGASAILVTSLSITADMIGNNVESGAFVYGAMSFCDKISCGTAILLINELKEASSDPFKINPLALGYTATGCSLLGVVGVISLTYIIYRQNKETSSAGAQPHVS